MRSLLLSLLLLPGLAAASHFSPPVNETVDLAAVTLNRLVLQPTPTRVDGLLPVKKSWLPLSVQLYLRPSGQLNFLSRPVQRAAAQIRRAVAPAASEKSRLRDSRRMAAAVHTWMDANLPLGPSVGWSKRSATDRRLAWPRVSAILEHKRSDADGRAMAAVALLRALRVPARVATARGRLACQYWVALKRETRAERKERRRHHRPKPKLGYWLPFNPNLQEAEIDAWSLDPGVLARVRWYPGQDLDAPAEGWSRAVFTADQSPTARAAFLATLALGRLTDTAGAATELSPVAEATLKGLTRGTRTLYVLTLQRFQLGVQGTMAAMDPVDILAPYRPELASWGREQNGCVREMEVDGQGIWTDRPGRLRLHDGKPRDEWRSPPPALGVLHYLSFGMRRFGSVMEAKRDGDQVSGVILRDDNLTPRSGWTIDVIPRGTTVPAQSVIVGKHGHFAFTLTPTAAAADWVELSTPPEKRLLWKGDRQILRRQ